MIIDDIKNIAFYDQIVHGLKADFELVSNMDRDEGDGRFEFEGGFFMVQSGRTKPIKEGNFETHDKYVDVHILLDGSETLAWAERDSLDEIIAYNEHKDATYYSGEAVSSMQIGKGMFYIVFPHDGHKAVRHITVPTEYRKIVMKLPVAELDKKSGTT